MDKMNKDIETKKDLSKKTRKMTIETKEGRKFLEKYSGATKRVRKSQLKKYLFFRKKTGKELINEMDDDWQRSRREREFPAEHHIGEFEKWLEGLDFSDHTISSNLAAIRAFYKFNNYPLNPDRLNSRNPSSKTKNQALSITPEKMKKIYNSTTSKRNKALLLFLYQTGQSASQISQLDYGDVKPELEREKYPLKISYGGRKGSGLKYHTFLGADGIEALKDYLKERRRKLNVDDLDLEAPLFAKRNGKDRLTPEAVAETLKYIAQNSPKDVITKEEMEEADINPLRPHAFRKNFKTTLVPVANNFAIEYTMGHQLNKVERSYWVDRMGGQEGLRKYYAKEMEPHLSIDVDSTSVYVDVSSDLKDDWAEETKERLGDDFVPVEKYERDVKIFRDKYVDTTDEVDKLRKRLSFCERSAKRNEIGTIIDALYEISRLKAAELKPPEAAVGKLPEELRKIDETLDLDFSVLKEREGRITMKGPMELREKLEELEIEEIVGVQDRMGEDFAGEFEKIDATRREEFILP